MAEIFIITDSEYTPSTVRIGIKVKGCRGKAVVVSAHSSLETAILQVVDMYGFEREEIDNHFRKIDKAPWRGVAPDGTTEVQIFKRIIR